MNIVFDFDGTLLDSSKRHTMVLQKCLEIYGYGDISADDYLKCKADGKSTEEYLLSATQLSGEECSRISKHWVDIIENTAYMQYDHLYDDAVPALEMCKRNGHRLYLLSARQKPNHLFHQVNNLDLADYFMETRCVFPVNAAKWKGEYLKSIGAEVIIGDTETEVKAAKMAGIAVLVVNRGFRSKLYWDRAGIKSYDTLLDVCRAL